MNNINQHHAFIRNHSYISAQIGDSSIRVTWRRSPNAKAWCKVYQGTYQFQKQDAPFIKTVRGYLIKHSNPYEALKQLQHDGVREQRLQKSNQLTQAAQYLERWLLLCKEFAVEARA